jgi:hypothetical protein
MEIAERTYFDPDTGETVLRTPFPPGSGDQREPSFS